MSVKSIKTIDRRQAVRYMGGSGCDDAAVASVIDKCEGDLLAAINPVCIYRVFRLVHTENGISLEGCDLTLTGKDISEHLYGCDTAVLMAASLSVGADRLIRAAQVSDMLRALVLDGLASAAVEQLCDICEEDIRSEHELAGKHFTWRYSPGYGDLPIELQGAFLEVLNAQKRIGLCATDSSLLTPSKSVTAIIGVSEHEISQKRRGCQSCTMNKTCPYRMKGEHCGL